MENDFIFFTAVAGFGIMTLITLFALRYAESVKEEAVGYGNWNTFKKWMKHRDDMALQLYNWEEILEKIQEAEEKRLENPNQFPNPVEALAIQLTVDYTITKNE